MSGNPATETIAMVAAMHREISGLVRGWRWRHVQLAGNDFRVFESPTAESPTADSANSESPRAVAIAAGMGARSARLAAQAIVNVYEPKLLISCGIAGSLIASAGVGDVRRFGEVLELETGCRFRAASGDGVLITAARVLDAEEKRGLAAQHNADAVDMEAAGVAAVAAANHIPFLAIKAISDELDAQLPRLNRFIRADGSFATGRFILNTALHASEWRPTIALAGNTRAAIAALGAALGDLLDTEEAATSAIKSKAGANRIT